MSKALIFIAGTSAGLYLARLSLTDLLAWMILAGVGVPFLVVGSLFHLGISDFQEYE
jgi:hypothetical protein